MHLGFRVSIDLVQYQEDLEEIIETARMFNSNLILRDGPIFKKPIDHRLGEIVLRDERFYYCDILPGS